MNNFEATGNYYTINHVVLISGLTDRTIRNYISSGILKGEKINGLWHFTPEQVEEFLVHPAVRPSILTKNNSAVYDFLADTKKKSRRSCMIFDLPGDNPKAVSEYFCNAINNGGFRGIRFSFDAHEGVGRVILTGDTGDVLRLVNGYYDSGETL